MNDVNERRRIDNKNNLNIVTAFSLARDVKLFVFPRLRIRRPCVPHDIFRSGTGNAIFSDVGGISVIPSKFDHVYYLTTKFGEIQNADSGPARPGSVVLLADDLHQHALAAAAVKLPVENLPPWAEVELALGDATTLSRPMTWRFRCASALSSPGRL